MLQMIITGTSTSGFPEGDLQQAMQPASVGASPTLVCHWIMKKKSGRCHISIRPSKTSAFTVATFDPRGEKTKFLFAHLKRNESKQQLK